MGNAYTCDQHGRSGIVEENDLWIGPEVKSDNGMTEEIFNQILDELEEIYSPIVRSLGRRLQIQRDWRNGTVNAFAQQLGTVWRVAMFGGLARHHTITPDAFALVACHELGHHLGGLPKISSWWGGAGWASNEGQSDYFGTMKCFRKYAENHDNQELMSQVDIPEYVVEKCSEVFSHPEEHAVCTRSAMAGLSLGELFRVLRNLDHPLQFDTPDPRVVSSTDNSHPAPQCRLDTYFQAALCDRDHYDDVSNTNPNQGVCSRSEGDELGLRPLCWYRPVN